MQKIRSNIKIVAVASDVIVLAYFVMNLFYSGYLLNWEILTP